LETPVYSGQGLFFSGFNLPDISSIIFCAKIVEFDIFGEYGIISRRLFVKLIAFTNFLDSMYPNMSCYRKWYHVRPSMVIVTVACVTMIISLWTYAT